MLLRITPTIRNEWYARCISDVVPALATLPWGSSQTIEVDNVTAIAIRRDCEFYMNPNAVDASAGTRAAYRALRRQIDASLAGHQ